MRTKINYREIVGLKEEKDMSVLLNDNCETTHAAEGPANRLQEMRGSAKTALKTHYFQNMMRFSITKVLGKANNYYRLGIRSVIFISHFHYTVSIAPCVPTMTLFEYSSLLTGSLVSYFATTQSPNRKSI